MTADDRPSVTDDARAEALEQGIRAFIRHGQAVPDDVTTYDREAVHADLLAIIDDANRDAGRAETTTATVEDVARVLYLHDRHDITPPGFGERMWAEGHADGGVRQKYLGYAQALADAGLLATARTRPTCGATTNDAGPCVLDPDHVTVSAHTGPSGWSWNDDVTMARFDDEEAE